MLLIPLVVVMGYIFSTRRLQLVDKTSTQHLGTVDSDIASDESCVDEVAIDPIAVFAQCEQNPMGKALRAILVSLGNSRRSRCRRVRLNLNF